MTNMATWLAALATVAILVPYELALASGHRRKPERLARTAHAALREEWFAAVSAQKGSEMVNSHKHVDRLRTSALSASQPTIVPESRNGTEQRTYPGRHCHGQCAPEGHAQRALGNGCATDHGGHGPKQGQQECGADDSPMQQ